MDIPLEIVFHGMKPSAAVEALVREHVGKLEKRFEHIIGCRVAIEIPHRQHRTGNVPEVHIEIRVPRKELVISREPHKVKDRRAKIDVNAVLKDAFGAAEKQLTEYKRQLNGDVKPKDAPLGGYVSELIAEKSYGFIATGAGEDLYFHRNSVADDGFDDLREGDAVQYTVVPGDKGPGAGRVWRTAEANVATRARDEAANHTIKR
ncbi:MAG TPA: HPF/RaiA family ribosome-associated protein [Rhizomicrobium sp.]|jgi:cold shock CspA family protein/ribosome-associated translation inhibitor RaiA